MQFTSVHALEMHISASKQIFEYIFQQASKYSNTYFNKHNLLLIRPATKLESAEKTPKFHYPGIYFQNRQPNTLNTLNAI